MASVLLSACVALGAGSPKTIRGAASPERSRGVLGVMSVRGQVWLGGVAVPAATAVYEGDTVRTAKDAAAVMRLRSGMTVALGEQGEVELAARGTAEELRLKQGVVTVSQAGPSAGGRVEVLGRQVELRGRGGVAAVGRIAAVGGAAEVRAERGELEILGRTPASQRIHLQAGEVARLEVPSREPGRVSLRPSKLRAGAAAEAPQGVRKAGEVSGEIPSAKIIERQGKTTDLPLHLNDGVNWQDMVQTVEAGRVRIQLLDGSVLNVGARSQMSIIEHNPQTQQTQVELTLGRVRSQVVKLTKPGASFEMRTQTAVIGVVGTIFVVEATPTSTRVICIEGKVTVENINPSVRGRVQLQAGQSTTVLTGAAPTAAAATNAAELQTALNRTEVQPGLHAAAQPGTTETTGGAQPVARGAAQGVSGAGTTMSVGSAAAVAAGGVSAVAGVTALTKANDASSALNQANTALANATAAGNAATDAGNAATTAINQSNQSTVSPSTPCGCGP